MRMLGSFEKVNEKQYLFTTNCSNLNRIAKLKDDVVYTVDLNETRSKRTAEQNKYMWMLIGEIDKAINGYRSNDEMSIYIHCLELAGAKCEKIVAPAKAEKMLKETFRAVQKLDTFETDNGFMSTYKVYFGSSKMDTKEMSLLIEQVLDLAEQVGVETESWIELLK